MYIKIIKIKTFHSFKFRKLFSIKIIKTKKSKDKFLKKLKNTLLKSTKYVILNQKAWGTLSKLIKSTHFYFLVLIIFIEKSLRNLTE